MGAPKSPNFRLWRTEVASLAASKAQYEADNSQYQRLLKLKSQSFVTKNEIDTQAGLVDVARSQIGVAEAALAGGLDQGTRGDRYQVVVHVDAEVLADAKLDYPAACNAVEVVLLHEDTIADGRAKAHPPARLQRRMARLRPRPPPPVLPQRRRVGARRSRRPRAPGRCSMLRRRSPGLLWRRL